MHVCKRFKNGVHHNYDCLRMPHASGEDNETFGSLSHEWVAWLNNIEDVILER